MSKKLLVVLLVALFVGSAFLACKKEAATPVATEPTALSVWAVIAAEIPLVPEEIAAWNVIERKTNTNLNWNFVSSLSEVKDQQFNLMVASGDIPDIVAYYEKSGGHTTVMKLGSEGAFVPLENLIAQHAPNLQKRILNDPAVREAVTAPDGHIYHVPMLSALSAARGWFIRDDWLAKVGMQKPKTTEELYRVLVAFRDMDPNGNGKKDEIPMLARRRGEDWAYNLGALAYAFNADVDFVLRDGKVAYGPAEPQYRDYLAYIARLYGEKLIDQEILTRGGNPRDALLSQNVAGVLHDWFASTADLNTTIGKTLPDFKLTHFAPPMGTVNKPFTRIQQSLVRADGGWSISVRNPDPVATIKLMDFIYSDEGIILTNFGVEGQTYTMNNGKPQYLAAITANPNGMGMHESLVSNGAQWKIGMVQSIDYERQFANAIATEARLDYMQNYIVPAFPLLSFTAEEAETLKDKLSQIRTLTNEMSARVMVGAMSAADFANTVSEMQKVGLADVLKIYQTAYDRTIRK
ncbi:MAG: extracellular solute-binding protein [Spirochaetes bacterium]|nr:extracellular solute-binding protein [Spirochaetota bacterium]MBU0956337.1 extracellular solute-binding protein [Spirochaetota bacterium]